MKTNRNKQRGKVFERKVAKAVSGYRYPADTGEKFDVYLADSKESDHWGEIQCKHVQSLSHQALHHLVVEMFNLCFPEKFSCVAHEVPPGQGQPAVMLVTTTMHDFVTLVQHGITEWRK